MVRLFTFLLCPPSWLHLAVLFRANVFNGGASACYSSLVCLVAGVGGLGEGPEGCVVVSYNSLPLEEFFISLTSNVQIVFRGLAN